MTHEERLQVIKEQFNELPGSAKLSLIKDLIQNSRAALSQEAAILRGQITIIEKHIKTFDEMHYPPAQQLADTELEYGWSLKPIEEWPAEKREEYELAMKSGGTFTDMHRA